MELQHQLRSLTRIGIAVSSERNLTSLLHLILKEACAFTNAEGGTIYLKRGDSLAMALTQNELIRRSLQTEVSQEIDPPAIPISSDSLAGYVALTLETLNIEDAYKLAEGSPFRHDEDFDRQNRYRTKSIFSTPLKDNRDELLGVLQLVNARDDQKRRVVAFNKELEPLLQSMASQAAVSIRNAMLVKSLNESYLDTLTRLSVAVEYRDPDTALHLKRMSNYAAAIAESFGLPMEHVEDIRATAPMHDIGKIGISDAILLKPGKLTDEEMGLMQQHPRIGADILGDPQVELLKLARTIILTHHERYDGKGYPGGLKGEQIPIEGRVVSIADVFDALSSVRPYKPAFPVEQAFEMIQKGAGTQFDPELVRTFEKIFPKIVMIKKHLERFPKGMMFTTA